MALTLQVFNLQLNCEGKHWPSRLVEHTQMSLKEQSMLTASSDHDPVRGHIDADGDLGLLDDFKSRGEHEVEFSDFLGCQPTSTDIETFSGRNRREFEVLREADRCHCGKAGG